MKRGGGRVWLLSEGSILLEVLAAMLVLAVLIGPMVGAFQSALGRAAGARQRMDGPPALQSAFTSGQAWEWGPMVASAVWLPGPVLELKVEAAGGAATMVGVWLDGWFLGEQSPDALGSLRLEDDIFCGLGGTELVARLRVADGAWGPPWRSIVPDSYGGVPGDMAKQTPASGLQTPDVAVSIAHVPALANPAVSASWSEAPVTNENVKVPLSLVPATPGRCDLSVGEQRQSWWMEEERELDLYY